MINYRFCAGLIAMVATAHIFGVDPLERITAFRADSQALASGEYKARIAKEYSAEATKRPLAVVPGDEELERELAAARKQLLEARAAALESRSSAILRGDVDTLKRQVAENIRNADGQN